MMKKSKLLVIALGVSVAIFSSNLLMAGTEMILIKPDPEKPIEVKAQERTEELADFLDLTEAQVREVYKVNLNAATKAKELEKKNRKDKRKRVRDARILKEDMQKAYKGIFNKKQHAKYLERQRAVESAYEAQMDREKNREDEVKG